MNRVVVTRAFVNICTMQVCAEADASDEEILTVCNQENLAGTERGWTRVIREAESEESVFQGPNKVPVPCANDPGRLHFLVLC